MIITLSDGTTQVEILAINTASGQVDWKRTEGYTGACVSYGTFNDFSTMEADIVAAIESELA